MSPFAVVKVAGRALVRNKMRSALTALGIVIGVGAVIAMVAIGEGARRRVEATFEAMGTNLLIVLPGSATSGGMMGGTGSQATITWADLTAIRKECKAVAAAAPLLRAGKVIQSEDRNWTTGLIGTSPDYLSIRNWSDRARSLVRRQRRRRVGQGRRARRNRRRRLWARATTRSDRSYAFRRSHSR